MVYIHPSIMELIARDMGVNTTTGYEILSVGVRSAQALCNEITGTILFWSFIAGIIAFLVTALIMTDECNRYMDTGEKVLVSLFVAGIVFVIAFIVIGSYYVVMYHTIESQRLPEFVQLKNIAMKYGVFNI